MLDNFLVGKQIANLRKKNGFTQEELAEKLEISPQAISKWENGHTFPETIMLPLLAKTLNCSIDSILTPFASQDSIFQDFTYVVGGKAGDLILQLYHRMLGKIDFTISYDEEYHVFAKAFNGSSAIFNNPKKDDFIIRMDVKKEAEGNNTVLVRLSLPNCSNYMYTIENMPEYIKKNFRCSDCKSCTCSCPFMMAYTFEGIEYKQCHFITIALNSPDDIEHILKLVYAEYKS